MSVARVTEIIASSAESFDAAIEEGIQRSCKTLENVTGAWVQSQKVTVKDCKIVEYRVNMMITFVLKE